MTLTWTTERPKMAGRYWARWRGRTAIERVYYEGSRLMVDLGTECESLAASVNEEWAGPIPTPSEPEDKP